MSMNQTVRAVSSANDEYNQHLIMGRMQQYTCEGLQMEVEVSTLSCLLLSIMA